MATQRLILPALIACFVMAGGTLAGAAPARIGALETLAVNDQVDGDVVVVGGDVHLGPRSRVQGHVVSVFGTVTVDPGAEVEGRVIALSSLANPTLSSSEGVPDRRLGLAVRVAATGGWLLATTLAAFLLPVRIRYGVWTLPSLGLKTVVLGALVAVTLVAALVAVVGMGPTLGVPLALVVAAVFLAVKTAGLAILGCSLGGLLIGRIAPGRSLPITAVVFVGVTVMMMARFLPLVGGFVWTALTVVALGVGVFTFALAPGRDQAVAARTTGGPRH